MTAGLRLNVRGTVTMNGDSFTGRVNTYRGRLSVRQGKELLLDVQTVSIDRLSKKQFSATLEDGTVLSIATEGCGCGGGR